MCSKVSRRDFLGAMALASASAAVGLRTEAAAASASRKDWFLRNPRVFLLDSQMPDPADQGVPGMPLRFFERLDPEAIVEQVAAAGADALLVHAKDNQGNCYYHSKVAHRHSSIGDRDLMREYSKHCRARGLTLLYYVQLSRERRSFTHPERRARDAQGNGVNLIKKAPNRLTQEEAPVVCLNGPHGDYTREVLRELSSGYDFDGFWLDCFGWWGRVPVCHCDACRASYRRDTGRALPADARRLGETKDGRAYLRWRQSLNARVLHSFIRTIRETNPRLSVTHNGSSMADFSGWTFSDEDDYVSHEFHYNQGLAGLSLSCRKQRAIKPGRPFEIEIWRFGNRLGGGSGTSRDYQVRPVAALLAEMAAVCAHGGFPQYYDQINFDGTLDRKSLERLRPAFQVVRERAPWVNRGQPVSYASLLWSKSTDTMASPEVGQVHREDLEGVHHALIESHLPLGILTEPQVERGEWGAGKAIVVPSAECLSDACLAGLRAFVASGGGLVVTGRSALATAEGEPREDFGFADLLGVSYRGMTKHHYTFVCPDKAHPVAERLTVGFPLSVSETFQTLVRAAAGTEVIGTLMEPLPGFHMGYPPYQRTEFAALAVRPAGKGRVVYLSSPQGAVYRRYNHPDQKQLLANAVTWAAGGPPLVSADGPGTLEVIAWRDDRGKETIIHLINRTGGGPAQGQSGTLVHETIPLHDVTLRVHSTLAASRAITVPDRRPVPLRREGDAVLIDIKRVEEWTTVLLADS